MLQDKRWQQQRDMKTPKKKFRIIVRPWVPRKIPYQILTEQFNAILKEAYPKLKKVVYIGWAKRVYEGKKQIIYLVATGDTGIESRKIFKTSENFGEDIWVVR